ncbi:MAG: tRNA 2-thiouridine(34) synthase MnmA [Planctomycetota bacterium]|jgi:tRNA-specific 2-thiouridylase
MSRVVLAMSGGVDSSVAAWLLRERGHEVLGLFMRHGAETGQARSAEPDDGKARRQGCCSAADAADARRVADALGIPFYALNFEEDFSRLIDYFVEEYTAGRTPNPCIMCNTWLKFGKLFEYADGVDARFVATGHHARIESTGPGGAPALCRGRDASKDQSYVLFGIDRGHLDRLLLPVGEHEKDEVRRIAGRLGFSVAEKPDSQEICFVPDGDHARLVRSRRGQTDTSGEIVTTDGAVVGRHDGLERFTVGQRKGLGVAFGQRRFVVRLEADTRRVVVGTREDLARTELVAEKANWLIDEPSGPIRCQVKIRYRSRAAAAAVEPMAGGRFRARFDEPRHGVAPGQAAVCYQGDRLLVGGWIQ